MQIVVKDYNELQSLVATLALGLCVALESNGLTIEEAENYLFSPYTMNILEEVRASSKLVDLVHLGTELGNVERIIPDQLQSSLDDMKSLALSILRSRPKSLEPKDKWLHLSDNEEA